MRTLIGPTYGTRMHTTAVRVSDTKFTSTFLLKNGEKRVFNFLVSDSGPRGAKLVHVYWNDIKKNGTESKTHYPSPIALKDVTPANLQSKIELLANLHFNHQSALVRAYRAYLK